MVGRGLPEYLRNKAVAMAAAADSGPAFGGFGLGPSSPELLLGVLASCLKHTYLIGAARRGVPLDEVNMSLAAENNDAHLLELESRDPALPFNLRTFVRIESPAPRKDLETLHDYVELNSPLTRIVPEPQYLTIERGQAGA